MTDTAQATFSRMDEGTAEDWQAIGSHFVPFAGQLADRVLTHLKLLDGDYGGFPIDRLQHSLQTATRAHQGGESEDYVVMALIHDIRDRLRGHPHFEDPARFCELYDQTAFDAGYESAPLAFFEPMVRRVFAAPKNSIYRAVGESA